MPERAANDETSSAPTTPRVSGERSSVAAASPPASSTRRPASTDAPEPGFEPAEPTDTLLSVGAPAAKFELMVEDRLAGVDDRLQALEQRIQDLEQRRPVEVGERRSQPWLWVVFLVAIAAVFQLLRLAQ